MSSKKAKKEVIHFNLRGGFTMCGQFVDIEDGCRFQTGPYRNPKGGCQCPSKELGIKTIITKQIGTKIQGQMIDFQGEKIIIPDGKGKVYLDHVAVHFSDPVPFGDYIVTIVELDDNKETPSRLLLPSIADCKPIDGIDYRVGGTVEFGTWIQIDNHKIWCPDTYSYL